MKRILFLIILFFPTLLFSQNEVDVQNIIIIQPKRAMEFGLNVSAQTMQPSDSKTINLLSYTSGDTTGVNYSIIGSATRTKLWSLPSHSSGDIIRPYSVSGNMVSAGQTARSVGIGMKGGCEYSFKIPAGYKYFRGYMGHDEEAGVDTNGFAIYGDNTKIYEYHGMQAWDKPISVDIDIAGYDSLKIYVFSANPLDHISILDGYLDKEASWDARLEASISGKNLNIDCLSSLPTGDYKIPIIASNSKSEVDTDSVAFHINPPDYLSKTVFVPNDTTIYYYYVPVKVLVPHQTGMRSDFKDVEFFDSVTGDTLWSDIFRTFGSDSAYFIVRMDVLPNGGRNIEYRYAFSNGHKNQYNNDLYLTNFYDPGHGIPSHLMPMYRDTTTGIDRFTPGDGGNERGYIVVDSTGKYYFFASATQDYDQSKTDGCQIYLYTSLDSGKTWNLEHNGDPLWTNHWGEDIFVFKNPFTTKTQWVAYIEDESRANDNTYTHTTAFIADSLMQATWTFVDTVFDPSTQTKFENSENGTPGAILRGDTLWIFYEGIGQYESDHPHRGLLCYAFATDSASVFHPTRYSNNPIMGSPWNISQTDFVTENDYDLVTDWILYDGQHYHLFSHLQTPYLNTHDKNSYVMGHWISNDFFHWTLDPDTTTLLTHRVFNWIINSDVNFYVEKNPWDYLTNFNTDKRWLYDLKYHKYPQVRRWGGAIYNIEHLTGDTMAFNDIYYHKVDYNGQVLDGLYVNFYNKSEAYRSCNFIKKPQDGYIADIGIIYREGDSPIVHGEDSSGDHLFSLETTNPNDYWRIRVYADDGSSTTLTFPDSSGIIADKYYQVHLEVKKGGDAKLWYKLFEDNNWIYDGSTSSPNDSTMTQISIGNLWTDAYNFKCDIMYISISDYDRQVPNLMDVVR